MFNTYSAIRRALALVACSLTLTTSLDSSLIGYCAETHDETTSATNCAIVVGVRNYDPDQFQVLTNAEAESTAIFELLLRAGYSESVSRLITNSSGAENAQQIPSRTNILRELEQACLQLAPNDKLVFAFGGYGVQATEGKFYLCPLDADLDDIETLIPIDRIYELIGKCRAEHKLIVIDAMHGNTLADSFSPGISGALKFQLPKLPQPPANTAVFLSCSEGESTKNTPAAQSKELRGVSGSFMACVAKAISGEAAGADGSVTLPDLERYVKKQYSDRTDLANVHPQMHNNTTGLFPLIANSLATDQMEKIQDFIREDRYDEALVIVEKRLVSHPQDAMALAQKSRLISYQAEQFRNYSRMNEAMSAAESAVQAAPNESLPYIARANAYRINKQYEKAFADASTAVQCDPNNAMAHVIRGFAFHHLHDLEGMSREAKLGMEIDPANPEARATYAAYLFAKGKIDDGIKELDKAIAVCPKMAALYFLKGYAMDKKGKYQDAAQLYGMAIKINDQIPGYFCRRAVSHANYGNSNAAMADIAAAEKILPTYDDIASARTMVIQKQQGYGKAGQAIAEGLKANPRSADLLQGQGFDFYNKGQYEKAIESFNKALEVNPGYGVAHMGIGMACMRLRKYDEAMVHLNRATRHEPNLARAYYEKSEVLVSQGKLAEALEELENAIQYAPTDAVYVQRKQVLVSTSR